MATFLWGAVLLLPDCGDLKPLLIDTLKIGVLHELPAKKSTRAVTLLDISLINTKEL